MSSHAKKKRFGTAFKNAIFMILALFTGTSVVLLFMVQIMGLGKVDWRVIAFSISAYLIVCAWAPFIEGKKGMELLIGIWAYVLIRCMIGLMILWKKPDAPKVFIATAVFSLVMIVFHTYEEKLAVRIRGRRRMKARDTQLITG